MSALEAMAGEAAALSTAAAEEGIVLQAVGGVGIWHALPVSLRPTFAAARPLPSDLDLVGPPGASAAVRRVFDARGYAADERLIAWYGKHRHRYQRAELDVDVFLGSPPSCHELDVRLDAGTGVAMAPTDLLLQKLQIHEINAKDVLDTALLLAGTEIDAERVAAALRDDWGFYHSATVNLERVAAAALPGVVASAASERANALREAVEAAPKSRRWRLRARVGTRVQWYADVEELDR